MPTELPNQPPSAPEPPVRGGLPGASSPRRTPPPEDGGAYRILTVQGIPIRLHWTFLALLFWVFITSLGSADEAARSGGSAWGRLIFVMLLFTCVLLHELGHALTALRYGIRTRDIVLYLIGGIASLERQPRAREELWIALAGPAVNVVIAGVLAIGLRIAGVPISPLRVSGPITNLAVDLMWANLALAVFNLLPAFPMDGGRVLRALLARSMDEARATIIAARVGQFLAIVLGLVGLFGGGWMLIFIAFVVFLGAGQEASVSQARSLTEGHRVREAMLSEFKTLTTGTSLQEAAARLLAGSQQDFPVMHGQEVVGVLSRGALLRGIATEGQDGYVAGVMEREFPFVRPDDPLETILDQMAALSNGPILVMEGETRENATLVGMVTQENLLEFLALSRIQNRPAT